MPRIPARVTTISIMENHFENQMKFLEVLASNDEFVDAVFSRDNGVLCIRAAIRHPKKTSSQRTMVRPPHVRYPQQRKIGRLLLMRE